MLGTDGMMNAVADAIAGVSGHSGDRELPSAGSPAALPDRLESIQILRGIAAVSVMLGHFIFANGHFATKLPAFSDLFAYAWLGVLVFFVISGFVIPYAMRRAAYRFPADAGGFLLRRIVRLEPPYLIATLLAVVIGYVGAMAPGFRGPPFQFDLVTLALQPFYLPEWFERPWILGVAWTLALELQYYGLMLVLGPMVLARGWKPWAFLALIAALSWVSSDGRLVFRYLPCFAIGFVAFLRYEGRMGDVPFLACIIGFGALVWDHLGWPEAVASMATAAAIFVPVRRSVPFLSFLGAISYSLYLTHGEIGSRVINLTTRLPNVWWVQIAGLLLAIAVAVAFASLFWRMVERPSLRISRAVAARELRWRSAS